MTESAPKPPRSPAVIAGLVLLVVVAAGGVADRVSPAALPRAARIPSVGSGGIWVCPVVSFGNRGGIMTLANSSVESSRVRVRIIRPPQASDDRQLTLAPGHAASLKIAGGNAGAGAIVQWSGGDVVASRSAALTTSAGRNVAAGAACSRTGETTLIVPGLRTLARDAHVVLLNPSSADSVVDVSFLVAGDEQAPETLTSRVVAGRGRLDVRVGDFVFDKDNVAAVVRVRTGTVVADGVQIGPQSAFIVPATAPRRDGVAAGAPGFGGRVDIATIGEEPSTVVSTTLTSAGQQTTARFPPALDPLNSRGIGFSERGALAVSLSGRVGPPFVATLGWPASDRGAGDVAAVPFAGASKRWVGVTQSPIKDGSVRMVLCNPGSETVRVRARLLTSRGQVASGDLADIMLLPGRALAFPLDAGGGAVGVEVIAVEGPIGFALIAEGGLRNDRFLYAVSGAAAQKARVSVSLDDRMGIPARLEP